MCDNIPLTCGGDDTDALGASAARMATPRFDVVKSAYDNICTKIKDLQKSPAFLSGSPNTLKLYQKLLQQKESFLQAIKEHPGYEKFSQERDKKRQEEAGKLKSIKQLNEEELEKFREKWKKMASPKKAAYLGALAAINRALAVLTEDKKWCHRQEKKQLFKFLVIHRNKLCRKLAKFPPVRSESLVCFRFKPCSLKIVKYWEVTYRNKRGGYSKKLEVQFDESIIALGFPKINLINEAIGKYEKFILSVQEKMCESLSETKAEKLERLEILDNKLQDYERRLKFLVDLRTEIEAFKAQQVEKLKAKCEEKYGPIEPQKDKLEKKKKKGWVWKQRKTSKFPPPGFWRDHEALNTFASNLEFPSKKRLEDVLTKQQALLENIEKIEKITKGNN